MDTPNFNPDKYRFVRALRPFSFSVAIVTCGLGIAIAFSNDSGDVLKAVIVVLAGVLLQAASNLANDQADLSCWKSRRSLLAEQVIRQIKRNFRVAVLFTLLAVMMGLWLVWETGWPLLVLGLFGVVAGYFYTGEPVVYKHRGLGVPAVFLLTGVLMVSGAYYAVSGEWNNDVLLISLPVSMLPSALLVSNEIRDYLDDQAVCIQTMTVRLGFNLARVLYLLLILSVYPISYYLYYKGLLNQPDYLLLSLLFVWQPVKQMNCSPSDYQLMALPPLTGRFFMVFGICFICGVL